MRSVWAVVKREYLQRVRSKWFVVSTFLAPMIFLGLMVVPAWFGANEERTERRIGMVDRTGVLADRVTASLEMAGYEVERVPEGPDDEAGLGRRVARGELGGYLVLDDASLARGAVRWVTESRPSTMRQISVRQAVSGAALESRLAGEAGDLRALLSLGELDIDVLSAEGASFEDPVFIRVYMGTFVLYMTVLLYAVAVMRSVLEEKTNRIVEVIVSSMRPWHLMLGKILGVGAVGLTQLTVWVLLGVLVFAAGIPALMTARPELTQLASIGDVMPGPGFAALFLVFFLGGFFIFAGLYAAVGAMCSSDQEAQQAQTPLVILLVVPIVALIGVMQNPTSTLSVWLSLVPFFSPILMFARAAMGAAPAWQIALSVVLMGLTVIAVAWLAGRIYKTGILMAGKRPTLPELIRWVREA